MSLERLLNVIPTSFQVIPPNGTALIKKWLNDGGMTDIFETSQMPYKIILLHSWIIPSFFVILKWDGMTLLSFWGHSDLKRPQNDHFVILEWFWNDWTELGLREIFNKGQCPWFYFHHFGVIPSFRSHSVDWWWKSLKSLIPLPPYMAMNDRMTVEWCWMIVEWESK